MPDPKIGKAVAGTYVLEFRGVPPGLEAILVLESTTDRT
jgi:hypothetical protein